MSPSIITEASQPLTARSTVAQRKQANELRKVRGEICTGLHALLCFLLLFVYVEVQLNNMVVLFFPSRLLNPYWRSEDALVSTTVSATSRA